MQESEAALMRSLSLRSSSAEAHYNLGMLMLTLGRMREAQSAWMNATRFVRAPTLENPNVEVFRIDPGHAKAWTNLFVLLDETDQCEEVNHEASYYFE